MRINPIIPVIDNKANQEEPGSTIPVSLSNLSLIFISTELNPTPIIGDYMNSFIRICINAVLVTNKSPCS